MTEYIMGIRKHSRQIYFSAIIMATLWIGVLFYGLNYYTPLFADDYSYSFSFLSGERITSVSQIVSSQIGHYQNTNGRSVTHTLAQLFLLAGDRVFNFVNVFFFIFLMYIAYFHACGTFRNFSLAKFSLMVMLVFLSCPEFGQSFLWITGAANYLYGILIVLTFLIPYRMQIGASVSRRYPLFAEIAMAILYLGLGIVAGWTNENNSVALNVMIIAYIIYFHMNSMKVHAWHITGCIGSVIGLTIMLLSPGTSSRLDGAGGSGGVISWIKRIVFYTCDMVTNIELIILLFSILLVLYLYQRRGLLEKRLTKHALIVFNECGVTLIYLLGFLASVYSMIVSPQFPGRAWSGPVIFSLITVISLSSLVDMTDIKLRTGKYLALGFLLVLSLATYFNAFYELKNVDSEFSSRVAIIDSAIAAGETSVEVPNIYGPSGYSCYKASGDLNADSSKWPNIAIAEYYGLDEIVLGD